MTRRWFRVIVFSATNWVVRRSQCAIIVRDKLVPRSFLRYSPDTHFVLILYAVLTLLKLSLTEFCKHMQNPRRTVSLVKDVAAYKLRFEGAEKLIDADD